MRPLYVLCALLLTAATAVLADPVQEATRLKDEALEILKANAQKEVPPKEYARCIYNLEKALVLLESAGQTDSSLAVEVNNTLFWSRRFSNLHVINELEKMRGGQPPTAANVPKKTEPPKPPEPKKTEEAADADGGQDQSAAKKAFEAAQAFAQSKAGDDYAIALSYFKMATDHAGSDYALKALELAREAQARFAAKSAPVAEALPDTSEMKPVREADALVAQGKLEEAIPLYIASIAEKETAIAHRKLGKAYFKRAQQMKEDLMPKLEASQASIRSIGRSAPKIRKRTLTGVTLTPDPNHPPLKEAIEKHKVLVDEAVKALGFYDKARDEFQATLRLVTNRKDLDAAGHIGLCYAAYGRPDMREKARQHINQFLRDYRPTNDLERSLYEFNKTELDRIRK